MQLGLLMVVEEKLARKNVLFIVMPKHLHTSLRNLRPCCTKLYFSANGDWLYFVGMNFIHFKSLSLRSWNKSDYIRLALKNWKFLKDELPFLIGALCLNYRFTPMCLRSVVSCWRVSILGSKQNKEFQRLLPTGGLEQLSESCRTAWEKR